MHNRVLLIEDDIKISEMVENYLKKEGYTVTTAFDGEEGVRKFFKNPYDILLLDIMMPKLNGMDVIKIVREKRKSWS